jgi:hypothetical protein
MIYRLCEEVNTLMCRQPAIRAPFNGWSSAYFWRVIIRPGISFSANSISRRPNAARLISATFILLAGALILKYREGLWSKISDCWCCYCCCCGVEEEVVWRRKTGRPNSSLTNCPATNMWTHATSVGTNNCRDVDSSRIPNPSIRPQIIRKSLLNHITFMVA